MATIGAAAAAARRRSASSAPRRPPRTSRPGAGAATDGRPPHRKPPPPGAVPCAATRRCGAAAVAVAEGGSASAAPSYICLLLAREADHPIRPREILPQCAAHVVNEHTRTMFAGLLSAGLPTNLKSRIHSTTCSSITPSRQVWPFWQDTVKIGPDVVESWLREQRTWSQMLPRVVFEQLCRISRSSPGGRE